MLIHLLVAALPQTSLAASTPKNVVLDDMVVMKIDMFSTHEQFTVLIPPHERRSLYNVMMGRGRKTHSITLDGKQFAFNCEAGHTNTCHCSMEIDKKKTSCGFNKEESKRDEQKNCFVQLRLDKDDSGATCSAIEPSYKPETNTLRSTTVDNVVIYSVPEQDMSLIGWRVDIQDPKTSKKHPIAIQCDPQEDCKCSITMLPFIASAEKMDCPLIFESAKRDFLGTCQVSVDTSKFTDQFTLKGRWAALENVCKTLGEVPILSRKSSGGVPPPPLSPKSLGEVPPPPVEEPIVASDEVVYWKKRLDEGSERMTKKIKKLEEQAAASKDMEKSVAGAAARNQRIKLSAFNESKKSNDPLVLKALLKEANRI